MKMHNTTVIDAGNIRFDRLIRRINSRREVYEGDFDGKAAIIKIFLSYFKSKYHFLREQKGFEKLVNRNLAAPKILGQGRNENGNYFLVLERIPDSEDVSRFHSSRA